jgi:hypothetical protein
MFGQFWCDVTYQSRLIPRCHGGAMSPAQLKFMTLGESQTDLFRIHDEEIAVREILEEIYGKGADISKIQFWLGQRDPRLNRVPTISCQLKDPIHLDQHHLDANSWIHDPSANPSQHATFITNTRTLCAVFTARDRAFLHAVLRLDASCTSFPIMY